MKKVSFLLVLSMLLVMVCIPQIANASDDVKVTYRTHVQSIGWQDWVSNGEMAGTQGSAKRMESFNLKLQNAPTDMGIRYKAHVQGIGWQDWVYDGGLAGTSGLSKRMEALGIELVNAPEGYHIEYRAHVQSIGWQDWVRDGETAGTEGLSKRIEAIEIRIIGKRDDTGLGNSEALLKTFANSWFHGEASGELSIIDNKYIRIRDTTDIKNGSFGVLAWDSKGGIAWNRIYEFDSDGKLETTLGFELEDDTYSINASSNLNYKIVKVGDEYYFDFSDIPYYTDNIAKYREVKDKTIGKFIRNLTDEEKTMINNLATEITKGINDEYDKVYAIANWVSDNIYYDYDSYLSNDYSDCPTDAIGVLEAKRTVCQGYSVLTNTLLDSIGIPSVLVRGSVPGEGHAWNEAYVNGRWIIFDTTWNSENEYRNGEYLYKGKGADNRDFDLSLEGMADERKRIESYH